MGERYIRHWRPMRTGPFHPPFTPWRRGPYRRRVTAAFKVWLWESGEILPYPGWYEVWCKQIPRWLMKRRGLQQPYVYIER